MAILLNVVGYENSPWVGVLRRELPQFEVLEPHEVTDVSAIQYAAVWQHPHNDLQRYPNLKAVLNLGAGTDHIDQDPALEHLGGIPVVRLLDPDVGIDMAQYTLYWAMHFQRGYERYREQAAAKQWGRFMGPRVCEWRVTVLGLGRIGQFIANKLQQMEFITQAWNRSPVELEGVTVFSGQEQFHGALSQSDVVVNCLPLNEATRHMLGAEAFAAMPQGAHVINISRGAVIDQAAMIDALQAGHLAGAALDCFEQEPLAEDSPLWETPNVYVTPHMSGATFARSAALHVVENVQKIENGQSPEPIHRIAGG